MTPAQLRSMLSGSQARIMNPEALEVVVASVRPPPPTTPEAPRARLLWALERLARQHGWIALESYNRDGPDAGVQCILWLEVTIVAELPMGKLTETQLRWITRLRRTEAVRLGRVEVYIWREPDLPAITARLAHKGQP